MAIGSVALASLCAPLAATATATPAASGAPFTIGTAVLIANSSASCPADATCKTIRVSCPGIQDSQDATVAKWSATAPVRGVLNTYIGLEGNGWLFAANHPLNPVLRADGFDIVGVSWASGWTFSAAGEDAGSGHLACRSAAAIKWVYENEYLPLGLHTDTIGRCGFCAVGHSAGSAQVAYALAFYGLADIVDAAVIFGGPSHAAQAAGCTLPTGSPGTYSPSAASLIDSSYGYVYPSTAGPCYNHDSSFTPRWNEESVESGGSAYSYPVTRVHLLNGSLDDTMLPKGQAYIDRLNADGSPYVTYEIVPGVGHDIHATSTGQAAIHAAILADTGVPVAGPPPPTAPTVPPGSDTTAPGGGPTSNAPTSNAPTSNAASNPSGASQPSDSSSNAANTTSSGSSSSSGSTTSTGGRGATDRAAGGAEGEQGRPGSNGGSSGWVAFARVAALVGGLGFVVVRFAVLHRR